MIRAWVLNEIGDVMLENVEIPEPKANEVRIRVMAAGICGSDIPRIYETGAHRMPLIPGHELSGVVEGIGNKVPLYWMGKRVAVFPKIACGKCRQCRDGKPQNCTDYDYIGSRRDGAFAEYVNVPMDNLLELPDSVTFEQAAMMEPMAVAANAMRTGCMDGSHRLSMDKPIGVCGLGTIGTLTVMFLKEAGFQKVFAIGNREFQKERVMSLGILEEHYCDSTKSDAAKWLRDVSEGGVYAYYECVGKNRCVSYGLKAAVPGACMMLIGNPYSDMNFSRDEYWSILRNQLTIHGIWNSSFRQPVSIYREDIPDDWNYVLQKLGEGKIEPEKLITHRFPLNELEKGFRIMRDKTEDYCKILMVSV